MWLIAFSVCMPSADSAITRPRVVADAYRDNVEVGNSGASRCTLSLPNHVEGCRGPPMTAGMWNRLHGALDTAGGGRSSAAGGFSTVEHASTRLQVGCERSNVASKRQLRPAVSGVRFVSFAWGGPCWLLVIVLSRQCLEARARVLADPTTTKPLPWERLCRQFQMWHPLNTRRRPARSF
jgi:hypothetical protein